MGSTRQQTAEVGKRERTDYKTISLASRGITSTSVHQINIKSTSTDRGSQDEDNNTFPMFVTHKTSEISSNPSREKTKHATGYFDQTTTKAEDPKKHREIHLANDDRYDPVCNSHRASPQIDRLVKRQFQNIADRNFDVDTRCATARFVRHRELAWRNGQQGGSCKTQTITTNQTRGFTIRVNS
ncbi:hypothetical protein QTP88_014315 [Uroleucon formosanum]